MNLDFLTQRPIAHRGLHDRAKGVIENSREAFQAAVAGNYAIECDLQLTSDGAAVVFHDDTLERLTAEAGPVKNRTQAQLTAIPLKGGASTIPRFKDVLSLVAGAVPLVIELKSHWDGDTRLAARAIEDLRDYRGACCIMSFDPDMIEAVRTLSPSTVRGIVADRVEDEEYSILPRARRMELMTLSYLARTQPQFISYYFRDLPFAAVTAVRQTGRPVITWTIRSPEQAEEALRFSDQITFEGYRP